MCSSSSVVFKGNAVNNNTNTNTTTTTNNNNNNNFSFLFLALGIFSTDGEKNYNIKQCTH